MLLSRDLVLFVADFREELCTEDLAPLTADFRSLCYDQKIRQSFVVEFKGNVLVLIFCVLQHERLANI